MGLSAKRQQIIDCMQSLIGQIGFERISVDMLCKEAGVSRGTFYYYFKNKEEVLVELFYADQVYTPARMTWALSAPTIWERILRLHCCHPIHVLENGGIEALRHRTRHILLAETQDDTKNYQQTIEIISPFILQAQQAGEILNMATPLQFNNVTGTLQRGLADNWCIRNGEFDLIDKLCECLETVYCVREDLRGTRPILPK